jgi:broad specificity phosphatase PhoE
MALQQEYTFIFIRHGEKAYANSKGPEGQPSHDPPLTKDAELAISKKREELTSKYGKPKSIMSSPYLRARETSRILSGGDVEIMNISSLSEFLGHQGASTSIDEKIIRDDSKVFYPDVYPETAKYNLPRTNETRMEIKKRVKTFTKALSRVMPWVLHKGVKVLLEPGTYWIVTHGFVMFNIQCSYITFKYDVELVKRFKYLEGFTVENKKSTANLMRHDRPKKIEKMCEVETMDPFSEDFDDYIIEVISDQDGKFPKNIDL